MPALIRLTVPVLFLSCLSNCVLAQKLATMRVILDAETFHPEAYSHFQAMADKIAGEVDLLIPGMPKGYSNADGIICFEASPAFKAVPGQPPPITLIGPKVSGEPQATKANTIRIALNDVQPRDKWRLAYQLSHELAHVKMGPNIDNYLIETFAVAVSHEVLRRLGFQGYLLETEGVLVKQLPEETQTQMAYNAWPEVQSYWQSRIPSETSNMSDRPFQTLGAILLQKAGQPNWPFLLGLAERSNCPTVRSPMPVQLCRPDISQMKGLYPALEALGYPVSSSH